MAANDVEIVVGAKDQASKILESIEGRLETFGSRAKVISAGVAASVVAAFSVQQFKEQIDEVDELSKSARKLGMSVSELQKFRFAFSEIAGIDASQTDDMLTKLTVAIGKASFGNKEAAETFETLGLKADELAQVPLLQAYQKIAAALQNVDNESQKLVLSQKLFGKSATDIVHILNASTSEFKDSAQAAEDLGLTLSDFDAQQLEAVNDALGRAGNSISGLTRQLLVELSPTILEIAQGFTSWSPAIKNALELVGDYAQFFTLLGKGVQDLFSEGTMLGEKSKQFLEEWGRLEHEANIARVNAANQLAQLEERRTTLLKQQVSEAEKAEQAKEKAAIDSAKRVADEKQKLEERAIQKSAEMAAQQEQRELEYLRQESARQSKEEFDRANEMREKLAETAPELQASESRILSRGPGSNTISQVEKNTAATVKAVSKIGADVANALRPLMIPGLQLEVVK